MVDDFADLDLPELHQRTYLVRSYRQPDGQMRLRGVVQDLKPPGLYIPGDEEPLEIHRMVVDLVVEFPSLVITDARVVMETHPHDECVRIEDHYRNLIGLSVARGFTHKVRELFGGPRGCTHTTALLQAMGPVAIQSTWSMRAAGGGGAGEPVAPPRPMSPEDRTAMAMRNLNTCHVWAEDGELIERIRQGGEVPIPDTIAKRLEEHGVDVNSWRTG